MELVLKASLTGSSNASDRADKVLHSARKSNDYVTVLVCLHSFGCRPAFSGGDRRQGASL